MATQSSLYRMGVGGACSRGQITLTAEQLANLEKRRHDVQNYEPVKWRSKEKDPVSGEYTEGTMVNRANIVFFGPYGSGKSSLIGSLFRAVNCVDIFPEKVWQTLNHPDEDTHGTLRWLETWGNKKQTIAYQDTRGDQKYDMQERGVHDFSLRGMYKDTAPLHTPFCSWDWWTTQRFFWERTLNEVPHCVVFVFDGSSDPFLDFESQEFFQKIFEDCTKQGYEPVIVVTCLDLVCRDAERHGRSWEVDVHHKQDKVLQVFENLHLTRKSIYFVTNFNEGHKGNVSLWTSHDEGFDTTTKIMVDIARDLLNVANRFIDRKYHQRNKCTML